MAQIFTEKIWKIACAAIPEALDSAAPTIKDQIIRKNKKTRKSIGGTF